MSDKLKGLILPSMGSLILPDAAVRELERNEERYERLRALEPGLEKQAIALSQGTTLGFAEAAQMIEDRYKRGEDGRRTLGDWMRTQAERRVYMALEPDVVTAFRKLALMMKTETSA